MNAGTTLTMNRNGYGLLAGAMSPAPEKTGGVDGEKELHPGPHEEGEKEVGFSADGAEIMVGPGATTARGPAVAKGMIGTVVLLHGRHEDARQPNVPALRAGRTAKTRRRFMLVSSCHLTSGKRCATVPTVQAGRQGASSRPERLALDLFRHFAKLRNNECRSLEVE